MEKWFLLVLLFLPRLVCAQGSTTFFDEENAKPAPAQLLTYQRQLPNTIRSQMGTKTTSLFWSQFVPQGRKTPIGLHLYNLWSDEGLTYQSTSNQGQYIHLALDVWGAPNSKKPKLLNRVFISLRTRDFANRYEMRFYWLDPKERKIPFLVLQTKYDDGVPFGEEHFIVFPSGWEGESNVQSLAFGTWHSSDESGQKNIVFLNNDDTLSIRTKIFPATSEITDEEEIKTYHFTYYWTGDQFYPTSSTPNQQYALSTIKSNGGWRQQ